MVSNSSNGSCAPIPNHDQTFFVLNTFQDVLYLLSLITCSLGLFLSSITFSVLFTKTTKTINDLYLIALSVTDFLCNLTGSFRVVALLSKWGYTKTMCRLNYFLFTAVPSMSWWLIFSVAFTRYLAIVEPMYFRYKYTKKKVFRNLLVVFLISMLSSSPFPSYGCQKNDCTTTEELKGATRPQEGDFTFRLSVSLDDDDMVSYLALYRIGLLLLVGCSLVALYGRILHRLWIWREKAKNRPSLEEQLNRLSRDRKSTGDIRNEIQEKEDLDYNISEVEFWTTFFAKGPSKLRDHLNATLGQTNDSNARQEAMYFNITALFLLVNIPYCVVETFNDLRQDGNPNPKATSTFLLVFVMGFNVNPFLFYFGDFWFREKINSIWRRIFYCGRGKGEDQNDEEAEQNEDLERDTLEY